MSCTISTVIVECPLSLATSTAPAIPATNLDYLFAQLKLKLGYRRLRNLNKQPQYLLSPSEDRTINVWKITIPQAADSSASSAPLLDQKQLEILTLKKTLEGHTNDVDFVFGQYDDFYSGNGANFGNLRYVVSSSSDKSIKIWDISTGNCVYTLDRADMSICLAWWYNTSESTLYLLDAEYRASHSILLRNFNLMSSLAATSKPGAALNSDGTIVRCLKGHKSTLNKIMVIPKVSNSTSPLSLQLQNDCLLSCSGDDTIVLWDLVTGEKLQTMKPKAHGKMSSICIYYMCRMSDFFVTGNSQLNSSFQSPLFAIANQSNLEVWNFLTGEQMCQVSDAHDAYISCVVYSEGLNLIVTSSDDGSIKAWKPSIMSGAAENEEAGSKLKLSLEFTIISPFGNDKGCKKMVFLDKGQYGNGSNSSVGSDGRYIVVGQRYSMFVVDLKLQTCVQMIEQAHHRTIWFFGTI